MKNKLMIVLLVLGILIVLGVSIVSAQDGTQVFINEFHYDNAGTDVGEAIEIAGPAGTDLTGWSLVRYNGSNGTVYTSPAADPAGSDVLNGTIPDLGNGFGVMVTNYLSNGLQNGSPDGIALVDSSNSVIQFLSYEGTFTAVGGPANGMTSTDIGVSEGSSTEVGHSLQLGGTGTTYEDFAWQTAMLNTFGAVNTNQSFGGVANAPVTVVCGSWLNTYEGKVASRSVSASDADGTVVAMSIDLSPIPTNGAITLENFVAATAVGETATGDVVVSADVPTGIYQVTVTAMNDDAEPQVGTCSFNVDVDPFLTIGEVQGVVEDDDDGTSHSSPYEGEYVAVQGVIYEKTQEFNSYGGAYYGFFIQNTADQADGNPKSSDGIFVFHNYYSTLLVDGGGTYTPQIGDEVILWGPVQERYGNTRLNNPRLVQVVRSSVVLDDEIPAFDVNPPATIISDTDFDDIQDAYRYWERREGMRGQIPAGSTVLNGRDVFASTFDSEIWVARPDSLIAQRTDPYERRAFRDVHPLDDIPTVGFDNDNPYRILMGTFGVKAAEDDTTTLLSPSRTFDVLENAPTGGVYYNFGKYSIQVDQQIDLANGVDPSLNNPPQAFDRQFEYSVVTFNVENLYDYVDDAFDGCDFVGNDGCPGVYPPFDYVPASDEVYQDRLTEIAQQIINDLHSPDIILAQEAEDQDVCYVEGGTYICPAFNDQENNADGKPDTLQELALKIYDLGGPMYDAALDRDGADDRGIISGYLYRIDRVELLPAMADDPVLGDTPTVYYPDGTPLPYNTDVQNPKALNAVLPDYVTGPTDGDNVFTRPPQVGLFRMWRDGVGTSVFTDLYISDNHFSSGPDNRVDQRTEQASYNAAIVAALQDADSEVYVTVGGDLNVYPRPDDPFPPPNESDQLAGLYNQGMTNLWNVLVNETPVSSYGYIYQGQSQTLDQMFVTPSWMNEFVQVNSAHINSDFPADFPGDGPRGTSDHDPLAARYSLLPTLDRLEGLLYYFDSMGEIYGNNTLKIMLDRIDRARKFESKGQMDAYADQLYAFASQAQDFAPDQMSQLAADALAQEALLLVSLP